MIQRQPGEHAEYLRDVPAKHKMIALMIVEWDARMETPDMDMDVKVTTIPGDLTVMIDLDGSPEAVMTFEDFQKAVLEAIGDLL